jgi:hypothetical protein
MARGRRRKCKCCRRLFVPDPPNLRHQCSCSQPLCREKPQAKPAGSPDPEPGLRPRARPRRPRQGLASAPSRLLAQGLAPPTAFKDVSIAQALGSKGKTGDFVRSPLQDLLTAQPAVLIGLIAHLVGTPLQVDIARTTDRLLRLGQDILAMSERPAPAPP